MKSSSVGSWIVAGMLALLVLVIPLPGTTSAPTERVFRIQASRFQYSPAVLNVNPGDRVTLELESADVVHGLSIDGYGVEMTADPGKIARLTFVAGQTGEFRFHCTVTCGAMHPFMTGKLYVGLNTLFLKASVLGVLLVGLGIWKLWK